MEGPRAGCMQVTVMCLVVSQLWQGWNLLGVGSEVWSGRKPLLSSKQPQASSRERQAPSSRGPEVRQVHLFRVGGWGAGEGAKRLELTLKENLLKEGVHLLYNV